MEVKLNRYDKKVELVAKGITNPSSSDTPSDRVVENIGFSEIKTDRDFEESPGSWRPIYRKTVDIGALPNSTSKTVNHNISNISEIFYIKGVYHNSSNDEFGPIPYSSNSDWIVELSVNKTAIYIKTNTDWLTTNGIITLEYTKTTDTPTTQPRY